jgi:mercuric ion binding protein
MIKILMKEEDMNSMKKAAVALLLVLTLAPVALAQINKVTIKVDGLACAFCAYGLQKELKRVSGVSEAKVYVDAGRVELAVAKGQSISFNAVEEAIKKGGYTPRDIWIEARGRIEQWNGRPALVIPENDVKLLLAENENLQKLNRSLAGQNGRSVTIAGKLQKQEPGGHHGHPHTLVIERFDIS